MYRKEDQAKSGTAVPSGSEFTTSPTHYKRVEGLLKAANSAGFARLYFAVGEASLKSSARNYRFGRSMWAAVSGPSKAQQTHGSSVLPSSKAAELRGAGSSQTWDLPLRGQP